MMKGISCLMAFCLILGLFLPQSSQAQETATFLKSLPENAGIITLDEFPPISVPEFIRELERFSSLKEVLLYDWAVTPQDMAALTAACPKVFFGFSFKIAEHHLRTDQTAFSTLHNNKSPTHTSLDFDPLRYCTRLEALDLGHNAVTDISFIKDLTNIKVLILALNQIEDISPLENLKNLQYLEIFRNKIRDISPLQTLTELLDLNLGYNYISDYSPLYGLDKLERLWLYQSNGYKAGPMKKETLREIAQYLPHCLINGVSAGTLGGWREHPRYDTIFDIFKTSVYKPFGLTP